ncbi:hypothetical protein GCM10007276_18680 [Agaricicola taiwanensis]|uniref:Uncharacterized protein n=1 Tax=Agaricicola taiwanensis TaxID=591372 RepID=A0A8J2W3Q1_9RHOB|nr:hypothetical protein GCM10007276_18680 [Agaricicola taiwanensis]
MRMTHEEEVPAALVAAGKSKGGAEVHCAEDTPVTSEQSDHRVMGLRHRGRFHHGHHSRDGSDIEAIKIVLYFADDDVAAFVVGALGVSRRQPGGALIQQPRWIGRSNKIGDESGRCQGADPLLRLMRRVMLKMKAYEVDQGFRLKAVPIQ